MGLLSEASLLFGDFWSLGSFHLKGNVTFDAYLVSL
jgi:hypothetical protein